MHDWNEMKRYIKDFRGEGFKPIYLGTNISSKNGYINYLKSCISGKGKSVNI